MRTELSVVRYAILLLLAGANLIGAQATGPTLLVTSEPSGAGVEVDGRPVGMTPYSSEAIAVGVHTVTVIFPTGERVSKEIVVSADQYGLTLPLEVLRPQPSTDVTPKPRRNVAPKLPVRASETPSARGLRIYSSPPHAQVFLDNSRTASGKTPLNVRDVAPGLRDVAVKLEGFERVVRSVKIEANKVVVVNVTFVPELSHELQPLIIEPQLAPPSPPAWVDWARWAAVSILGIFGFLAAAIRPREVQSLLKGLGLIRGHSAIE